MIKRFLSILVRSGGVDVPELVWHVPDGRTLGNGIQRSCLHEVLMSQARGLDGMGPYRRERRDHL